MPFQSLTLRDFQKHRRCRLEFDNRVTVITGASDKGKSAVVRALRLLCLNDFPTRPAVRNGAKRLKITAIIDGHEIMRTAGSVNAYAVDGEVYKAFGASVPAPVAELFNIRPENVQSQFDGPFWFALTPGQVAKELNRVIDLESIDRAASEAASRVRSSRATVEVCKDRLADARQRRKELAWVADLDKKLVELENQDKSISDIQLRLESLKGLVSELGEVAALTRRKLPQAKLERLRGILEAASETESRLESLKILHQDCLASRGGVFATGQLLKDAGEVLAERFGGRCPTCGQEVA